MSAPATAAKRKGAAKRAAPAKRASSSGGDSGVAMAPASRYDRRSEWLALPSVERGWVGEGDLAVPKTLPVRHLSKSSVELFERCQYSWSRRYLYGEKTPATPRMVAGNTVGAGLNAYMAALRDGQPISLGDVDDIILAEWRSRRAELGRPKRKAEREALQGEIERLTAAARRGGCLYLEAYAKQARPVSIEREQRFAFAGTSWQIVAYTDREDEGGHVIDYKLTKRHKTKAELDRDLQASTELLGRHLEGEPATDFAHHSMLSVNPRTADPVTIVATKPSAKRLRATQLRYASVARAIAIATERDEFVRSPHTFICNESCVAWSQCPAGGGGVGGR